MIGALIGAGMSAAGSIAGGILNRKAMRKARQELKRQELANQAWYDRRYNEDATQRADAQRLLTRTEEAIKNRNKAASGTQAVIGGTDESVAATKAANNEAYANTVSSIAAANEARKDGIEAQYHARRNELSDQRRGMDVQRAQNIATAVKGVTGAAGQIASAFDDKNDDKGLTLDDLKSAIDGDDSDDKKGKEE